MCARAGPRRGPRTIWHGGPRLSRPPSTGAPPAPKIPIRGGPGPRYIVTMRLGFHQRRTRVAVISPSRAMRPATRAVL